jgi:hypothetical protein
MLIIERLIKSIRDAAAFNPEVLTAPACILWQDHGCQWEAVTRCLQEEQPELVILGNCSPEGSMIPAFWRHQDFMILKKKSRCY